MCAVVNHFSNVWQPPVKHVQERPRSASWDSWKVNMIKVLWLTGDLKNQQEAEDQKDRPSVFVCVCVRAHMYEGNLYKACATKL